MNDKTTKAIFLDFDGVLNTGKYHRHLRELGKEWCDDYGPLFDPEAVANLQIVLDAVPDALLVISSSWKMDGRRRIHNMWRNRSLPGAIHSFTPDFVYDYENVDLSTPESIAAICGKGGEIRSWFMDNAPKGCRYVIFDDTTLFLEEQLPHLIKTDPELGITEENAQRAIELLTE